MDNSNENWPSIEPRADNHTRPYKKHSNIWQAAIIKKVSLAALLLLFLSLSSGCCAVEAVALALMFLGPSDNPTPSKSQPIISTCSYRQPRTVKQSSVKLQPNPVPSKKPEVIILTNPSAQRGLKRELQAKTELSKGSELAILPSPIPNSPKVLKQEVLTMPEKPNAKMSPSSLSISPKIAHVLPKPDSLEKLSTKFLSKPIPIVTKPAPAQPQPDPQLYFSSGMDFYKRTDFQNAANSFTKLIDVVNDIEKAKAYVLRGACYFEQGCFSKCKKDLTKALEYGIKDLPRDVFRDDFIELFEDVKRRKLK